MANKTRAPVRETAATAAVRALYPDAQIKVQGEVPYGLRQYQLVVNRPPPPQDRTFTPVGMEATLHDDEEEDDDGYDYDDAGAQRRRPAAVGPLVLASLTAHRNVVFGAKTMINSNNSNNNTVGGDDDHDHALSTLCDPLLARALEDCYSNGEQPQALSALHGLTAYVQKCLDGQHIVSPALREIMMVEMMAEEHATAAMDAEEDPTKKKEMKEKADSIPSRFEAIRAIATGIPRPGHTAVGKGTHRIAGDGWSKLAREFIHRGRCDECTLYQNRGGALVDIELLADTKPDYLKSAGGAMARFFFVGDVPEKPKEERLETD
jgi:hypothetical protein